jgi:uncharacterized protein (TIGR01777 family)
MKVLIAGGTGFLGNPLAWAWAEDGQDVRVLTRGLPPGQTQHESGTGKPGITRVGWMPDGTVGELAREFHEAAAVINLAGESIAGKRWSATRKQALRDSRILPTRSLAAAFQQSASPPPTFISASGVGYYGAHGAEPVTEAAGPGSDFLATLCVDWEAEARKAAREGVRVITLRNGLVLEKSGGLLQPMVRAFRLFAGGPQGNGRHYMPWIHRHDWVEMVRWLVDTPSLSGPVNATAPHPVTNREFAHALGRALRRPALVPTPGFALKLLFGELSEAMLTGQRAIPERAKTAGYHFRYPEIDIAFRGIFGD